MHSKIKALGMAIIVLTLTFSAGQALADKSAVTIEAPDQAARGEEVLIKLNVTHSGNNFFHYTNWVQVKVNGRDTYLKEYSMTDRPDKANFTVEFKLVVKEPSEIVAEANCNLHGSKGPVSKKIGIKE